MKQRFVGVGVVLTALAGGACTGTLSGSEGDNGGAGTGGGPDGLGTSGSASGEAASKLSLNGSPAYYRVMRLTNQQWTNSVQSALGLASPPTNTETFQNAVSGTTDFTNNELVLDIDSRGWSDFRGAAEALAAQVAADAALLSKLYSGTDGAGFIASVGRRIYRRPLTPTETATYQALFDKGPAQSGNLSAFAKGASLVLETMLQSPHFLYRTELGAAGAPLSSYEVASKLSLWLRDSGPDTALLDAAGAGQLDAPAGVAAAAKKLLDEAAAKGVMRQFHGQFLHFDKFAQLGKVGVPTYDKALNPELAESSFLFFDRIFSQGLGVKDIFLSTKGFVGQRMAPLYAGATAPASGFAELELGAQRRGFFQQLPFLMLYAHNDDPDPIHRGVSMSLDVLCAPLGIFQGVLPPLPDALPGQTNRVRVDEHTKGCGTKCHNDMINPLGFAFEHFDGMGQYREVETKPTEVLPIDASGSFAFIDGTKSYKNSDELMQVLASDKQAHLCYSKKLASFGLQRDLVAADLPFLTKLASTSVADTGSVKQVIVDLVQQDAFRVRAGGAQ
jgi:Protein of unknown function (DUF1592)/Protein of unknown function (DUF1595)/Protein of unknown function (DUF1588)/Protein of unknown function (DUF1585)/Protein of unknown function (DUF1587)